MANSWYVYSFKDRFQAFRKLDQLFLASYWLTQAAQCGRKETMGAVGGHRGCKSGIITVVQFGDEIKGILKVDGIDLSHCTSGSWSLV